MRKLVGIAVLLAGIGALGYVGTAVHAPRVERNIKDAAQGIASTLPSGVSVEVSGRDVGLTGAVADVDATRMQFAALDGIRVVNVAGLTALPVANPFELVAAGVPDTAWAGIAALTGATSPAGKAAAEDVLSPIDAVTDLSLWDDGVPFSLTMDWGGAQASASGKFPADFNPRGSAAVAVTSDAARSFLPDTGGVFTINADAGVAALGGL